MNPTSEGSLRIFRFAGVDVFLHWSWLLVAFYALENRTGLYSSSAWAAAEYVALFVIVILHEYGHALATRQVGGTADTIVLWPFGGVAYAKPPPRPGAQLWGIVAGPLVNVALIPVLYLLHRFAFESFMNGGSRELTFFVGAVREMNWWLLLFNILPIYPQDGGQILRSLLWFVVGPVRSLLWAAGVGFVGVAGLAWWAWRWQSWWMAALTAMIFLECLSAWRLARSAMQAAREGGRA